MRQKGREPLSFLVAELFEAPGPFEAVLLMAVPGLRASDRLVSSRTPVGPDNVRLYRGTPKKSAARLIIKKNSAGRDG